MSKELERIKQDLEVINTAAGFGQPPLGREDIWAACLLGVLGFIWAASSWLLGMQPQSLTILALGVSLLGILFYHLIYARSKSRTAARERGYRWSWLLGLILGVLIGGFYVWAKFFGGLSGTAFLGSAFIFSGALLVLLAVTDRWRLMFWGWAIPLTLFGCFVPFIPPATLSALTGAVVCIGGFTSAGILTCQLRAHRQNGKVTD